MSGKPEQMKKYPRRRISVSVVINYFGKDLAGKYGFFLKHLRPSTL
jgi:hypothetical protein